MLCVSTYVLYMRCNNYKEIIGEISKYIFSTPAKLNAQKICNIAIRVIHSHTFNFKFSGTKRNHCK